MPRPDEVDAHLMDDLDLYLSAIRDEELVSTKGMVEILATKMWELQRGQRLIAAKLDELIRLVQQPKP